MTRLEQLRKEITPFWVDTWSPGDGITRYRFFASKHTETLVSRVYPKPKTTTVNGYFGPDNGIYTALGYRDALAFAAGLVQGISS